MFHTVQKIMLNSSRFKIEFDKTKTIPHKLMLELLRRSGMRVFAFGCSLTQYFYPTWADILIHHYRQEGATVGENWGRAAQEINIYQRGCGKQILNII